MYAQELDSRYMTANVGRLHFIYTGLTWVIIVDNVFTLY